MNRHWEGLESLAQHATLSTDHRHALAVEIATALGAGFSADPELHGTPSLAAVLYTPTVHPPPLPAKGKTRAKAKTKAKGVNEEKPSVITFLVVPGGEYEMGIRPDERDELAMVINADDSHDLDGDIDSLLTRSQPVHRVRVRPFLCAARALDVGQAQAFSALLAAMQVEQGRRFNRVAATACLSAAEVESVIRGAPDGFRLLCEAEWEWVAREGGSRSWVEDPTNWINFKSSDEANAFGAYVTAETGDWVADAWFPSHEGAPEVAVARAPTGAPGMAKGAHSGWQERIEAVVTACAYREEGSTSVDRWVRLARDLP